MSAAVLLWSAAGGLAAAWAALGARRLRAPLHRLAREGGLAVLLLACLLRAGRKDIFPDVGVDAAAPYDTVVEAWLYDGGDAAELPGAEYTSAVGIHGTNSFAVVLGFLGAADPEWPALFWFRDSDEGEWESLADSVAAGPALDADMLAWTEGATNFSALVVGGTNAARRAQYWYGTDLPARVVTVEGGVELLSVSATATNAAVRYAVEASALAAGPTTAWIERAWMSRVREGAYGEWETLWSAAAAPGTNEVSFAGFMVDRRSRWRVRLMTEVQDDE